MESLKLKQEEAERAIIYGDAIALESLLLALANTEWLNGWLQAIDPDIAKKRQSNRKGPGHNSVYTMLW